jgi:cell division septal protein FtsQ
VTRRNTRNAKRKEGTAGRATLVGIVVKGLLALALVGGVVYTVAWLGGRAGERVVGRDRYAVRVADVACDAPPGKDRPTFLTEVRYLANLPETVQVVDPKLPEQLAAAFARHPWVAEVVAVKVEPDATVRVDLRFRVPVLAVRVIGDSEVRTVDRTGVLLPPGATGPLTELANPVLAPKRPAGEVWNDPTVRRAAELAAEHTPRRVEKTAREWRLTLDSGKVLLVSW